MPSLLIYASGYDTLSRAQDFFESSPHKDFARHYVHDNIHEEYRDPALYVRHIETTYTTGGYDHIVFWGAPAHIPRLAEDSYSCVFEDVDHILYPHASSENALIAWWKKRRNQQFFERARYIIALSEHSSQFLRENITGKKDQHFCLSAFPLQSTIKKQCEKESNMIAFDKAQEVITMVGNSYTHANLETFLKLAYPHKSIAITGSDLRNPGYVEAQCEYYHYIEPHQIPSTDTNENPSKYTDKEANTPSGHLSIHHDFPPAHTDILCLIDLHMTSGVSETLRWGLAHRIPVITLNHHSLSGAMRSQQYPLIISLARLSEIPDLIASLQSSLGERSEIWNRSQYILKKLSENLQSDQARSSRHIYFLIEKHLNV